MENKCQDIQEYVPEFVMGALRGEKLTQLQNHLNNCSSCRGYLRTLREIYYGKVVSEYPRSDSRVSDGNFVS